MNTRFILYAAGSLLLAHSPAQAGSRSGVISTVIGTVTAASSPVVSNKQGTEWRHSCRR